MDSDAAVRVLGPRGKLKANGDGTTALSVGHGRALSRTCSSVLADRAIGHAVDKVNLGVVRDRDLHVGNGKGIVRAARDFGALVWARANSASDAFTLKSSFRQGVPLSKGFGALKALKVEATIITKGSEAQITPVKPVLLLLVALIVCVGGALERSGVNPALMKGLAKGQYKC